MVVELTCRSHNPESQTLCEMCVLLFNIEKREYVERIEKCGNGGRKDELQ